VRKTCEICKPDGLGTAATGSLSNISSRHRQKLNIFSYFRLLKHQLRLLNLSLIQIKTNFMIESIATVLRYSLKIPFGKIGSKSSTRTILDFASQSPEQVELQGIGYDPFQAYLSW
jgi:hypothetical protein